MSTSLSGLKITHVKTGLKIIKNGVKFNPCPEVNHEKKPEWLKIRLNADPVYQDVLKIVNDHNLHTICKEAHCPNIQECWSRRTATFLLMGDVCTRGCKFCAVHTGNPNKQLDLNEPLSVANAVKLMDLNYVVLTSVNRDDLADGGAEHYKNCIDKIAELSPKTYIEILTPDFQGDLEAINTVINTQILVFAQNIETVKRLTHPVRDPRASYQQTLEVLNYAKNTKPKLLTKTSLLLGLGESEDEILETMADLRKINVDILTLGQYLRPTLNHLPVINYITPEKFNNYREIALKKYKFLHVVANPLSRSSYRAEEILKILNLN